MLLTLSVTGKAPLAAKKLYLLTANNVWCTVCGELKAIWILNILFQRKGEYKNESGKSSLHASFLSATL